jgi:formylglycine-generating enzyme required for sulfatase activity
VIGSTNHPIAYVSWGDAARFANWLHNGQPSGAQGPSTTETGAYALNGAVSSSALMAVTRNAGAGWFLPSEDEWYKAAYHQLASLGGDSDNYWLYPMRNNSVPYSDQPPGTTPNNTTVANFFKNDGVANGYDNGWAVTGSGIYSSSQNYLTDVGAYILSASFYGTFDQGGNVGEWSESLFSSTTRVQRGGSWSNSDLALRTTVRGNSGPTSESPDFGFRVATIVPEPASLALGFAGLMMTMLKRNRNNKPL